MSGQYALNLVDGQGQERAAKRRPGSSDEALLGQFVAKPRKLLRKAGSLRAVLDLDAHDLAQLGVGAGDAARLHAALALGRRCIESTIDRGEALTSPAHTSRALSSRLRDCPYEVFLCLFLDNRHRILADEIMFRGTISGAAVYPREVAKRALEVNAAALIACHNHPSGVAEPSRSDKAITKKLQEALALVEVRLLDHFVIGDGETCSFSERGWL